MLLKFLSSAIVAILVLGQGALSAPQTSSNAEGQRIRHAPTTRSAASTSQFHRDLPASVGIFALCELWEETLRLYYFDTALIPASLGLPSFMKRC
ncbi:hypothetical protein B0H11DRAFT_2254247 [Mycena galericulata]|nr:hypothetical protein B0H11DRAFT_2254247 [Mycena galericulata]